MTPLAPPSTSPPSTSSPPAPAPSVAQLAALARDEGLVPALLALHRTVTPAVLPAGPGGHLLVPATLAAEPRYTSPDGPRARTSGASLERLGRVRGGPRHTDGWLEALRIDGAGPAPGADGAAWAAGLLAVRLGTADALLRTAADRLRDRTVRQGSGAVAVLSLPMVRGMVGEAAAALAEARALAADVDAPAALRRAHRAVDACGRICLQLYGAHGFLTDGPGSTVRASELLAEVYSPADAATEEP
ncbi:acyl-CoA dehydrogenase family protein [Streptomyces sp. O3]